MTIKVRRDTAANWTSANPTLAAGQPGYETDTGKLKFGDGATAWTSLAYFGGTGTVTTVSVVTANGVSGSVATATTTPAITLTLGAITPTSVAASGAVSGSNLSGTNTGDQTSVTGNAGTATALQTGRTIAMTGDVAWSSPIFDGTGNVTAAGTIQAGAVTLAKMANMATASLIYRKTAGTGAPEVQTLATLKTDLGLTGTNSGDQTTITGNAGTATALQTSRNFSISGGGITAATVGFDGTAAVVLNASVDAGHVTLTRMANLAANSIIGNNTGSSATPLALTATQVRTLINVADGATANIGTVTSVGGTGTVSGLTLTGTVTTAGNLTLGGALSATSANISDFNSATRAQVEAELIAGANVTITPGSSGATRTLTIAASGGGGGAAWGSITGTLSTQTDLQSAMDGKQPLATVLTNTTAAFTTAQETKLAGVATGATANVGTVTSVGGTGTVSGLTLTGTVTASGNLTLGGTLSTTSAALTDFNSATRAQTEAMLVAGSGVTLTPGSSGATRTITVAASGGGSDPWTYVKLASDFVTSSSIAVDVTGMTFTPAANTDYEVEWVLLVSTATITVGPRPGAAWGTGYQYGAIDMYTTSSAVAESQQHVSMNTAAGSAIANIGGLPVANEVYGTCGRAVFRSGTTPTAFKLQLASETAATNVTAKAGSFLKYRKI